MHKYKSKSQDRFKKYFEWNKNKITIYQTL